METMSEQEVSTVRSGMAPQEVRENKKQNNLRKIKSRFGEIEVDPALAINFPHGILGLAANVNFVLTELPNSATDQFKLLQCMNDDDLSFIVVPASFDNQLLDPDDIADACLVLNIDMATVLLLFIVTVHVNGKERRLSVNAKAPVFVDPINRIATQYVLPQDKYEIRHMIS